MRPGCVRRTGLLGLAGLLLALPSGLGAQEPAGDRRVDLALLALEWTRGVYRAPLLCEIEGETRRGLRRVLVRPESRRGRRPKNEIAFFDLEVPEGTRCHGDLGGEESNVVGRLRFEHDARSRPDTARYDFQAALRREGGFAFQVDAGTLRVGAADAEPETLEAVDFAGGTLEVRRVEAGSDAARSLADFGGRRKLRLELTAPDGTSLSLLLVQFDER